MATDHGVMSNETFYGYVYPHQNRRYYLALVCSILIFPVIALGLILGRVGLIVPFVAMFTTAGEVLLMIGASDGTGVLPTFSGNCACVCKPKSSALVAIDARMTARKVEADCVM